MGVVSTKSSHRWPNGRVPFEIDAGAFPDGSQMRQVILDGIAEWNNRTPLRLVPRDPDADFGPHSISRVFLRRPKQDRPAGRPAGRRGGYRRQQSKADPRPKEQGLAGTHDALNRLHMLHLGDTTNVIWHSTFSGSAWTDNNRTPHKSKASPALAAFQGRLHMVHLDDNSNNLRHATSIDGVDWQDLGIIPNQKSKAAPALAVFQNALHMVHLGDSSNRIWRSVFDPVAGTWSENKVIPDHRSKASPALAVFQGRLHMVHLDDNSNNLRHATSIDGWIGRISGSLPTRRARQLQPLRRTMMERQTPRFTWFISATAPTISGIPSSATACGAPTGASPTRRARPRRRSRNSWAACTWCTSAIVPTIYGIPGSTRERAACGP